MDRVEEHLADVQEREQAVVRLRFQLEGPTEPILDKVADDKDEVVQGERGESGAVQLVPAEVQGLVPEGELGADVLRDGLIQRDQAAGADRAQGGDQPDGEHPGFRGAEGGLLHHHHVHQRHPQR